VPERRRETWGSNIGSGHRYVEYKWGWIDNIWISHLRSQGMEDIYFPLPSSVIIQKLKRRNGKVILEMTTERPRSASAIVQWWAMVPPGRAALAFRCANVRTARDFGKSAAENSDQSCRKRQPDCRLVVKIFCETVSGARILAGG
jgi:hypothetical protein